MVHEMVEDEIVGGCGKMRGNDEIILRVIYEGVRCWLNVVDG